MLNDGKKSGFIYYVIEGGEPFFRNDLSDILEYAKKINYITSVVTNGYFLKERYSEISPFTDTLVVSFDSSDDLHDRMRGLKGLYKRAVEGIQLYQNNGKKVIINSVICKKNSDRIEGLAKLSESLKTSIIFQPMDVYKNYNESIRPTDEEIKKTFKQILEMKKSGYPIINSYRYLKNIIKDEDYVCHAPKCYTYVEPDGNIVSCCDIFDKVWGNVRDNKFKDIFQKREFKDFCNEMETCNKCSIYAVIEGSLAYTLNPFIKFRQ
jgi:radical SAM protein with 4Fe4S-binding SPASM domain